MDTTYLLIALVLAYLMGSISFAVLVSKLFGLQDPRSFGSGNPGATNVLRSGSKKAAILTLLLDAAKGWLPVALVGWFGGQFGLWEGAQAAVGLAAFAGHLWPIFMKFKGGKGVATALGVLIGISPLLGLLILLSWLVVAVVWRYSSLSSVVAAVLAPFFYLFGGSAAWWGYDRLALVFIVVMSVLLLYKHAPNIGRLLRGAESKIGQKKAAATSGAAGQAPKARASHPFSEKKSAVKKAKGSRKR